jgi:hypothetical protein
VSFGLALRHDGADDSLKSTGRLPMQLTMITIQPLIALIAGILILIAPRILNYVVAIYLIVVGVTGLWPHLFSG